MFAAKGVISSSYLPANWSLTKTITINHTLCGGSNSTDFPMLFSGTYSYLKTTGNGGSVISSSGYDIVFYSDASLTTKLKFERAYWDGTTGTVEFWVKISTLSTSSDTVIYLGVGNSTITSDQQDVANVWTNSFALVSHYPDGTTLSVADSTGNNSPSNSGATATTGQIDGGVAFASASTQKIILPNNASLNISSDITLSAWIKKSSAATEEVLIGGYNGSSPFNGYGLGIGIAPNTHKVNYWNGTSWVAGNTTVDDNTWRLLHITVVSGTVTFYVNGSSDGTPSSGAPNAYAGQRDIGASELGNYFNGSSDEVRIATAGRSSSWVTAEWNNQNNPSSFYTIT